MVSILSMNLAVAYSIVFFNPDERHDHPGGNIQYCQSVNRLIHLLASYGQTRITVCICCEDEAPVLTALQPLTNIASIILCTQHHQNHHGIANLGRSIRQNSFNNDEHWQLEAHTDAFTANNNENVLFHIQSIIRNFIQQNSFPIHGAIQETSLD